MYDALLAMARENPAEADFHALRMAFVRTPHYQPYASDIESLDALGDALHGDDLDTALAQVKNLLNTNYLDIEAHISADYIYTRRSETAQATYHRAFARGLIDSIARTGNGRSFETAFIVITLAEEYTLLRMLGLQPQTQQLVQHEEHWFDVHNVRHGTSGEAIRVYFNVDILHGLR